MRTALQRPARQEEDEWNQGIQMAFTMPRQGCCNPHRHHFPEEELGLQRLQQHCKGISAQETRQLDIPP